MMPFYMSNQNVQGSQYNIEQGNINIGSVQSKADFVNELQRLQIELDKATKEGVIDESTALDAKYQLSRAILEAQKKEPDKKTVIDHLNGAKALLNSIVAAAELVTAFGTAIAVIQKIF